MQDFPRLSQRDYRRQSISDLQNRAIEPSGVDSLGNDYRISQATMGGADFVLEAKMVGQIAALARGYGGREGFAGGKTFTVTTYLFEGGRPFALSFQPEDDHWVSNINECLYFKDGASRALETATPGIIFKTDGRTVPPLDARRDRAGGGARACPSAGLEVIAADFGTPSTAAVYVSIAAPRAALFLGGSGRFDMHGTTARGDLGYGALLHRLAGQGIASLRELARLDPAADVEAGTPHRSGSPEVSDSSICHPTPPELQPALWVHVDEPIVNRHFDTLAPARRRGRREVPHPRR